MKSSTKAHLQLEDLMTELTSLCLTSEYSGTMMDFIVKWLDKMRLYESLTKTSEHFTPGMKKTMLQNAVSDSRFSRKSNDPNFSPSLAEKRHLRMKSISTYFNVLPDLMTKRRF